MSSVSKRYGVSTINPKRRSVRQGFRWKNRWGSILERFHYGYPAPHPSPTPPPSPPPCEWTQSQRPDKKGNKVLVQGTWVSSDDTVWLFSNTDLVSFCVSSPCTPCPSSTVAVPGHSHGVLPRRSDRDGGCREGVSCEGDVTWGPGVGTGHVLCRNTDLPWGTGSRPWEGYSRTQDDFRGPSVTVKTLWVMTGQTWWVRTLVVVVVGLKRTSDRKIVVIRLVSLPTQMSNRTSLLYG